MNILDYLDCKKLQIHQKYCLNGEFYACDELISIKSTYISKIYDIFTLDGNMWSIRFLWLEQDLEKDKFNIKMPSQIKMQMKNDFCIASWRHKLRVILLE